MTGFVMTFYPGAEVGHYAFCGVLVAAGLLIPNKWYRIAAVSLLVLFAMMAADGYFRGVRYREWLRQEHLEGKRPTEGAN
ncbi:MAG TPA: hypothetical protein VMY42_28020 [Thermoguttaceae bacterium]|nr:hypothetical protein [Thermoguttaceae bacterium]